MGMNDLTQGSQHKCRPMNTLFQFSYSLNQVLKHIISNYRRLPKKSQRDFLKIYPYFTLNTTLNLNYELKDHNKDI